MTQNPNVVLLGRWIYSLNSINAFGIYNDSERKNKITVEYVDGSKETINFDSPAEARFYLEKAWEQLGIKYERYNSNKIGD